MSRLARFAVARPRAALALWAAAIGVLALIGTGVESRLTQSIFVIPGTETARAIELTDDEFGESVFVPVLLEGPRREVERQGRELAAATARVEGTRVLSPWNTGSRGDALRPEPGVALIVVSLTRPLEEIFDETAAEMRELVDDEIEAPVEARLTGMPIIGAEIKKETYDSAGQAELLAIPILLIVLLIVFRAPLAALVPGAVGLASVLASAGVIWLLAGELPIDPIAISLASMMGLALGVDYSLLIVTRFREELAAGADPRQGTLAAIGSAGRTVGFAAVALSVAMLVAIAVSPGNLLLSATVGVLTATALSVASVLVAIPAALALLGPQINRWAIRADPSPTPRWLALGRAALRRPGLVAGLMLVPLLALSAPATGLDTGPPDVGQLPEDSRARSDFERVREVMGPGWVAPFEVVVAAEEGAITEPRRLRTLRDWQREIAARDDVAGVIGPGALARRTKRLDEAPRRLERGADGLARLSDGITRAEAGVDRLLQGQGEAVAAAEALADGSDDAAGGSELLEAGVATAVAGTGLLADAVERMAPGVGRLGRGLGRAIRGLRRFKNPLGLLRDRLRFEATGAADLVEDGINLEADDLEEAEPLAASAEASLEAALDELGAMTEGKLDPRYAAALDAVGDAYEDLSGRDRATRELDENSDYAGIAVEIGRTENTLRGVADQARDLKAGGRRAARAVARVRQRLRDLQDGLDRLREGGTKLRAGGERLAGAIADLRDGVAELGGGAARLEEGLGRLAGGNARLADGLLGATGPAQVLLSGLGRGAKGAERLERRAERAVPDELPGLLDSGYFVLAALEQAPAEQRNQAGLAVNADRGGEAGRVVVLPASDPNDDATRELHDALSTKADELGSDLGARSEVGGTASALAEYDEISSRRLPLLVAALALVSFLVLVPIFRSLALAMIAVILNLISVGAAFGALALLFQGSSPVFGGPGFIDAVSISAIYTVMFGLSLDYQMFLIARMREGWLGGRDTNEAIAYGLDRTAAVVTGAAAIMVAVFCVFAVPEIAGTRQFGVGLAIAVLIDATIVRLVLLPAAMRLAGDRCWTLPRPLERALPRLEL